MTQVAAVQPGGTQPTQFGYVAFFNSKREELYAPSLFAAKEKAIALFKPAKSKRHMVSVVLAEKPDGSTVTHVPDF